MQVEEVRRHSHCLAFSSAGPQSQTYYISYDSYTEYLRWQRTASKVQSAIVVRGTSEHLNNLLSSLLLSVLVTSSNLLCALYASVNLKLLKCRIAFLC